MTLRLARHLAIPSLASSLILVACTEHPAPLDGLPCDEAGRCEAGYACDATQVCIPVADCQDVLSDGSCQRCGDGAPTGSEQCDDGPQNDGRYGGCTAACTRAEYCGDGTRNGPEECDDGPSNGDDWSPAEHCNAGCTGPAPHCSDGVLDASHEGCDAGTTTMDGCLPDCTVVEGWSCEQDPAVADPGPLEPGTRCFQCGDGLLAPTEECDGGSVGIEGCTACAADDGYRCALLPDPPAPAGPTAPDNMCAVCGNGTVEPIELCDDGDTDPCTAPCGADCGSWSNTCGDGVARCGEECDGSDLASGPTCRDLGFASTATPACDPGTCRLDRSSCGCEGSPDVDGDGACDPTDATPGGVSSCPDSRVLLAAKDADSTASGVQLSAADQALVSAMESWGFTVRVLGCSAPGVPLESAAYLHAGATSRALVFSASCGPTDVSTTVLRWPWQGLVILRPELWSAAGLTTGTTAVPGTVTVTGVASFVTQHVAGRTLVLTPATLKGTVGLASGVQSLATSGGATVLLAAEKGATLAGDLLAAGRRIGLDLGATGVPGLTATGRALLGRALVWAAGGEAGAACVYCGGTDQDGDGFGEGCDCDDRVAECNDAGDAGTSELPARDCVRNWDGDNHYEFASPAAYVTPDCYEVACGSDWNKGDASAYPNHGTDCYRVDSSTGGTLIDAITIASSDSSADFILVTDPTRGVMDAALTIAATAGPVRLTSVVPISLGTYPLTVEAEKSVLEPRELTAGGLTLSATDARLQRSTIHVSGVVTLSGSKSTLELVTLSAGAVTLSSDSAIKLATLSADAVTLSGANASLTGVSLSTVSPLTLTGSGARLRDVSLSTSASIGVDVQADNCVLDGLDVHGFATTGIRLGAKNVSVQHSRIAGGVTGIRVDGSSATDSRIANNVLVGQTGSAIRLAVGSDRTTIDNNTITGIPGSSGPEAGIETDGTESNPCIRNNLFTHLGDGVGSGFALRLAGALTMANDGATATCLAGLSTGGSWQNAVFDATGNCTDGGTGACAALPTVDAARDPSLREHRFFPYSAMSDVDLSVDPAYADPSQGLWCIGSGLLVDHASDLGYARVPPYTQASYLGQAPDVGGLEAGAGVCAAWP